jgi:hypothetical protein
MNFIYLLFSHLLGDFVFQSYKLVKFKKKSLWGIIIHVFIHFFVSFTVLFAAYGFITPQIVFATTFIAIMHLLIDKWKIDFETHTKKRVFSFCFDQFLHLCTIYLASIFLTAYLKPNFGLFSDLIIWASFLIIITQVYDIYNFQKILEKNPKATMKKNILSFLNRILCFMVIFIILRFVIRCYL